MKPRIAVVTTWFPHENNPGEGAFVLQEVKNLQNHGVDIRVIHICGPSRVAERGRSIYEGVKVFRVPMSTKSPVSIVKARRQLSQLLQSIDIVHTHAFSSILPFAIKRPGCPWVHTEHWTGLTTAQDDMSKIKLFLLNCLLRLEYLPDVSAGVVDFLAKPMRKFRGSKPTKVIPVVVPYPDELTPYPQPTPLKLVSIGGLIPRKDPLIAAETMAILRDRGVDAELTWVGDGPLRAEVESLINRENLPVVLAGQVKPEKVGDYISQAHMFFGPTRGDNFFTSAAESIVRGRTVVAGVNGGHTEYLDPRVSRIVSEQTPTAYADAIMDLAANTKTISPQEVADTVGQSFSADTVAGKYIDIYEDLLHKPVI